jgi:hypothetical protein
MKTKSLAIGATVGTIAIVALLFAYPATAATTGLANQGEAGPRASVGSIPRAHLEVGQTITLTSTAGGYRQAGDNSSGGTASATITLEVTGALKGGYILSVSGGQVTVGNSTYGITGGSAELGLGGVRMVGQAQGDGTQMLFMGRNLGLFGTDRYGLVRVDLSTGSGEFGVRLLVTVTTA